MTEKRCPRCTETKAAEAFARRSRGNGLQPYCRPCAAANLRDWLADRTNRDRLNASIQASRAKWPERQAARRAVQCALSAGKIERKPCEIGTDCAGQVQAHHPDYAKPLEVQWLCRKHHVEADRLMRAAA